MMLMELSTHYNMALLIIERESVGWDVLQTVIDKDYPNLFYMSKDYKVVDVHKTVSNRFRTDEKQMLPGFGTTTTTREVMINNLDMYMRELSNGGEAIIMHSK